MDVYSTVHISVLYNETTVKKTPTKNANPRDVVYENKKKTTKLLGRYVMGDVLGEGSYAKVRHVTSPSPSHRIMNRRVLGWDYHLICSPGEGSY